MTSYRDCVWTASNDQKVYRGDKCRGRVVVGFENGVMKEEQQSASSGLEPLLNINELADYLGVPVSTIYDWRTNGKGPRAYRFGKRIMFGVTDIHAWMDTMREPSPGAASFPTAGKTASG